MSGTASDTVRVSDTSKEHDSKPSVAGVVNLIKNFRLPQLPHGSKAKNEQDVSSAATLSEVAGIITTLAKDHLGSLLVHPGHAIVGVYYLAKRHEMTKIADHIDGSEVGDKEFVQKLIRYVDISDSIYPDRYPVLIKEQQLVKESDILFFFTQVHKLQPGFYIAVDNEEQKLLWVIRGTHDIHDLLTDLCGVAIPLPSTSYPPGSAAHWGMWKAAGWLLDNHWTSVCKHLKAYPGYDLEIIGHSMGAGVGALLALRLNTEEPYKKDLGDVTVTCMGVATAACLTGELAASCAPYVTTLVMRYDLVPRFSTAAVELMQEELLEIDYKGLLHDDLMEHEVYRRTLERTKSAAEKIKGHKLTQAALAATTDQLAALQSTAAKAGEVVARHIDAAEAAKDTRKAAAAAAAADNTAAAAAAAAAGGDGRQVHPTESFEDEGEGAEATAAAAAGDIVDAQLFAPGRLLYVKPVDEQETEEQQRFELVDGHGDQRFKRIVLRSSCMADHFPAAYKMGLSDVWASVSARQQQVQQGQQAA